MFKYNGVQSLYMEELLFQATVRKEHRITIPEATRDLLGIDVGDTVMIRIGKGCVKRD